MDKNSVIYPIHKFRVDKYTPPAADSFSPNKKTRPVSLVFFKV